MKKQKKNRLRSNRAALQHIFASAYCCFRQDLTGFTPEDRTGPGPHRANGNTQYTVFSAEKQAFPVNLPVFSYFLLSAEGFALTRYMPEA